MQEQVRGGGWRNACVCARLWCRRLLPILLICGATGIDFSGVESARAAGRPALASAEEAGAQRPLASASGNGPWSGTPAGRRDRLSSRLPDRLIDACLGKTWLLQQDAQHPERPGRWIEQATDDTADADRSHPAGDGVTHHVRGRAFTAVLPVVRAGDAVIVDQASDKVRARLRAVALGTAGLNRELQVRLQVEQSDGSMRQGRVISVVAAGQGVVLWRAGSGAPR
jgi:hypothetical protein